jgi:hypothetical protein
MAFTQWVAALQARRQVPKRAGAFDHDAQRAAQPARNAATLAQKAPAMARKAALSAEKVAALAPKWRRWRYAGLGVGAESGVDGAFRGGTGTLRGMAGAFCAGVGTKSAARVAKECRSWRFARHRWRILR